MRLLPDPDGVGDLGDWDFEGDGADSSGNGITITCASCTFGTTPAADPVADIYLGEQNWADNPVVRAGATITLDGTPSISHDDDSTLTCVWSDQGGGSSGTDEIQFLGSTTACSTTAAFPTFGQYTLRLVVTDASSDTGTKDVIVGATATDSNDVVVVPDPDYDFILGPQLRWGVSPWPWFDHARQGLIDQFGPNIGTEEWNTDLAGTVALNGTTTVTGTSTDFQNDFCSGGTSPDSGIKFVPHVSSGLKPQYSISSCTSATSMVLTSAAGTESGITYGLWSNANQAAWVGATGINGSTFSNFYDVVMAYYSYWLATGLDVPLGYGNALASGWWDMPIMNQGENSPQLYYPRAASLTGIALWSAVNGTEATVWPGIADALGIGTLSAYGTGTYANDTREYGYTLAWNALCEALAPDSGDASACETRFDNAMAGQFNPAKLGPDGQWIVPPPSSMPISTVGTGTFEAVNGSGTFTCNTVASPTDSCGWTSGLVDDWVQVVPAGDTGNIWSEQTEYKVTAASTTELTLDANYVGTSGTGKVLRYSTNSNHESRGIYHVMPMTAMRWSYLAGNSDFSQTIIDNGNFLRTAAYRPYSKSMLYRTDSAGCLEAFTTDTTNGDCAYTADASMTQALINAARYLSLEPIGSVCWAAKIAADTADASASDLATFADVLFGASYGKDGGPSLRRRIRGGTRQR